MRFDGVHIRQDRREGLEGGVVPGMTRGEEYGADAQGGELRRYASRSLRPACRSSPRSKLLDTVFSIFADSRRVRSRQVLQPDKRLLPRAQVQQGLAQGEFVTGQVPAKPYDMPPVVRRGPGCILEWQYVAILPRSAGRYCPGHACRPPQARPRPDPRDHRGSRTSARDPRPGPGLATRLPCARSCSRRPARRRPRRTGGWRRNWPTSWKCSRPSLRRACAGGRARVTGASSRSFGNRDLDCPGRA